MASKVRLMLECKVCGSKRWHRDYLGNWPERRLAAGPYPTHYVAQQVCSHPCLDKLRAMPGPLASGVLGSDPQ